MFDSRRFARYTLTHYFDVWGNAQEGWEVNNQCVEHEGLLLPVEISDKDILTYLRIIGFLKNSDMRRLCVEDDGHCIEILERKGMRPIARLMPED